jgi:hypothetical protein
VPHRRDDPFAIGKDSVARRAALQHRGVATVRAGDRPALFAVPDPHPPTANLIGYTVQITRLPSFQAKKWRCPTNLGKSEIRNPKQISIPNREKPKQALAGSLFKDFGSRISNLFRISIFGFRIFPSQFRPYNHNSAAALPPKGGEMVSIG